MLSQTADRAAFQPILNGIARALRQNGVDRGKPGSAKGTLRVTQEDSVRRAVQAYWTPFEANIPGPSIGLHLEVAQPKVHWAECYLSPEFRNWVFFFHERPDGDIQLAYYADYATPQEAIKGFFDQSTWYVLTATDLTWADVAYDVDENLEWTDVVTDGSNLQSPIVQESLKKSTIVWLRWHDDDGVEQTMPVWFVYDQKAGAVYVLSGERQQTIPGAAQLKSVDVIFRWKGKNARVGEIPARVQVLDPLDPSWEPIAEKVAEKRLNIPGLPEDTARRWREQCVILELQLQG
ncbi:MAG: hypothetical protein ABR579_03965 [Actinomycetota bacterium]